MYDAETIDGPFRSQYVSFSHTLNGGGRKTAVLADEIYKKLSSDIAYLTAQINLGGPLGDAKVKRDLTKQELEAG